MLLKYMAVQRALVEQKLGRREAKEVAVCVAHLILRQGRSDFVAVMNRGPAICSQKR